MGSDKEWYHGELTRDEAEQALKESGCDCFLIRHCQGVLILSLIHDGGFHHINVKYGPGWYELENGTAEYTFDELNELVEYYGCSPISHDLHIKLGQVCQKNAGIVTKEIDMLIQLGSMHTGCEMPSTESTSHCR